METPEQIEFKTQAPTQLAVAQPSQLAVAQPPTRMGLFPYLGSLVGKFVDLLFASPPKQNVPPACKVAVPMSPINNSHVIDFGDGFTAKELRCGKWALMYKGKKSDVEKGCDLEMINMKYSSPSYYTWHIGTTFWDHCIGEKQFVLDNVEKFKEGYMIGLGLLSPFRCDDRPKRV